MIIRGKAEEARKTLKTVARINGKFLSDDDLASVGEEAQVPIKAWVSNFSKWRPQFKRG